MRIAIVTHTLSRGDGQGRVNYEVTRAALDRGHSVILVASSVDPVLAAANRSTWIRISVKGWPSALLRNQVFAWRSAQWLNRHRDDFDVMLANGFITWAAADLNAVHFVHSAWLDSPVHTARISSGPSSWYQWLYTTLNAYWERRAFRDASMLVAVSERVRDELIDIGVDAASIRVIPNGVDLDEFAPGPADRAALGLVENVPLALFVGDLQTPRKNLDTVLHMLQHVPDLHVAIVGDARNSSYPSLATTLGLTGRVSFLGYRTDVPRLFRAVDMCLCPSRYEPFSLVVLEALASGCPVITSRCVGATSVLTPSCGAVIEEPDDALALAGAVQSILDSDAETMRTAARSVALQYSWDRTATAYLKVLHRLGMSARSHAQGEAPHSPPTNRAHPAISPSPSSQP